MVKNHQVRFCVTKTQLELIKNELKAQGYVTISAYLRDLALNRRQFIELKITETNKIVKEILEVVKNGKQ